MRFEKKTDMTLEEAKKIVSESEIVKKLPIFLHSRDGGYIKPTEEYLDALIERIWIAQAQFKLDNQ